MKVLYPCCMVNTVITENVKVMLRRIRASQRSLVPVLELSQASVNSRFRGCTPWTIGDVERLAEHFGVDPARLLYTRAGVA